MKLKKRNRRGATAVEFALVAPMIFLLALGLMEWARFEMIRQVSSTAAFSAARLGTIPGVTETEVEDRVTAILEVYAINVSTVTSTIAANESNVTIDIPMNDNSWFIKRFFGGLTIQRDFSLNY